MKKRKLIMATAITLAAVSHGDVLFSSNFDSHNVAVDPSYVKDVSGQATATVGWTTDASVTAISGLTAVTGGGGFINQGTTDSNGDTLKVNYNLNQGADQGFSLGFTLNQAWDLDKLTVVGAHLNGTGGPQLYDSTMTYTLTGGTLPGDVTASSVETYAGVFKDINFDLTGTTLGAGSYTLEVVMSNVSTGGAYATFDGVTLEAIPEPSTLGLVAVFGGFVLMIRRKLAL